MITVRNRDRAQSLSARAAAGQSLVPGMLVEFIAGPASGDQPKVQKASGANMADATVMKGIVNFVFTDSQEVDFTLNTNSQVLTRIAKTIPDNAQVSVLIGKPIVAYHSSILPAGLQPGTIREGTVVGYDATTNLPDTKANSETGGVGMVYRIDGPEVTVVWFGL